MENQDFLSRTVLLLVLFHTMVTLGTATRLGHTRHSDSTWYGDTPHSDSTRDGHTHHSEYSRKGHATNSYSIWRGYTIQRDSIRHGHIPFSGSTSYGHIRLGDSTWHGQTSYKGFTQHGQRIHSDSTLTKVLLYNATKKTFDTKDDNLLSTQSDNDVSSLSGSLLTTSLCEDREYTLTNRTGIIALMCKAEHCLSYLAHTWNIILPSSKDGMVIQLGMLYLKESCRLLIFALPNTSYPLRVLDYGLYKFRPLFLKANEAKIVFNCSVQLFDICNGVLTYEAHPVRKMPVEIVEIGSTDFYICSGDILVPSALRCNKVRECAGNEDEHGCDYTDPGCGDWLPLRDQCLKLVFVVTVKEFIFQLHHNSEIKTLPFGANRDCNTRYGARLAQLKDMDDVRFVGHIIRQAGFRFATIGASRVKSVTKRMNHLYRFMWQWGDKRSPIIYEKQPGRLVGDCAVIDVSKGAEIHLSNYICHSSFMSQVDGYVCMKQSASHTQVQEVQHLSVHLHRATKNITGFPTRQCMDGSLVHIFRSCYHEKRFKNAQISHNVAMFLCQKGSPIHYTHVCDGNVDCVDASDETRCGQVRFPRLLNSMFICDRFQLVPKYQQCGGKQDCLDGSDEDDCTFCVNMLHVPCPEAGCIPFYYSTDKYSCHMLRGFMNVSTVCHNCSYEVFMDGFGTAYLKPVHDTNTEGVISCRDGDYSIPSYLINNGEHDCKYGEDENIPLTNLTCPGFYRCLDSNSCVHPDHVCDRIDHCPYKDDERYCWLQCPYRCVCEGHAFACKQFTHSMYFLQARSLDLSGSVNLSLRGIHFLELLQYLNISQCALNKLTLNIMPQLQILDFSGNEMKNITSFVLNELSGLTYLDVSKNPFLRSLDNVWGAFVLQSGLINLKNLILRHTDLHSITDRSLSQLAHLEVLDIRDNCLDHYDRHVFWGLHSLQQLYTDDPKLCCPYFHHSDTVDCVAPIDELSSCSDLLRQNFFRVFLWMIALLAILGNTAVVLHRLFGGKVRAFSSFRVLVTNLCVADLFMGVYMMMIGIADAQFRGNYVAKDNAWKRSIICKSAGLLGLTSSEASALTICMITLDRMLVLCFPLNSQFQFGVCTSLAACGAVWFVAVTLAAVPLMTGLQFYGVNSICLPLPITRRQFSGQSYSFGVFIVFNFVIFLVIGLGQILIYCAILKASKAAGTKRRTQEMTIARRLFFVILSDFSCWFPIGMMGILVASGIPISDEVNVWAAIFVIPLNSACNPFLYTLINFLEKRREEKLKKETGKLLSNMQTQLPKLKSGIAEELVRICIRSKVVRRERVQQILQLYQESPETIHTD